MKRATITIAILVVVISAVTAAFAVAETGRFRGAKQIPTVVTGQQPTPAVPDAPPAGVSPSALPAPAAPTVIAGAENNGATGAAASEAPPQADAVPDAAAHDLDGDSEDEREVVTPKVRDYADGSSSDKSESGGEDAPKPTSDSKSQDSKAGEKSH